MPSHHKPSAKESDKDDCLSLKDPVITLTKQEKIEAKKLAEKSPAKEQKIDVETIRPDLPTRLDLKPKDLVIEKGAPRIKYVAPETKEQKRAKEERHREEEERRTICKYEHMNLPGPVKATKVPIKLEIASPEASQSKVVPRKPSISPSTAWPPEQSQNELGLHKPRSGIFINETNPSPDDMLMDSFDLMYSRTPRPPPKEPPPKPPREKIKKKKKRSVDYGEGEAGIKRKKKKKRKSKDSTVEEVPEEEQLESALDMMEEELEYMGEGEMDEFDLMQETYLTKLFRRKVSQISKATSIHTNELMDFPQYEDEDLDQNTYIHKIIQKFRRDSEEQKFKPKPRVIKKGTLESHSFTKLTQKTLKDFYFGTMAGSVHQGDENFAETSRNRQGICIPVAAYCYSMIKHPNKWTSLIVDEILDVGTKLYEDSIGNLHMHDEKTELKPLDLVKYVYIGDKKMRFQVYEPEIAGIVRSDDKKVYNLSKGLQLFFKRHRAGILQTFGMDVVIWKQKHYYFFDGKPRAKNLHVDPKGTALLANFYDIASISTVLLNRSQINNAPYIISKVSVVKMLDKDEVEEAESLTGFKEKSDYNILNENKAVIQGSFDLGDLCFDFTRNKQSLAMAAVCLVYSRISPPSSWHKNTVDKIMIVGNQLYMEIVETDHISELRLEYLPAIFTIGPYIVEMYIYANRFADVMYRKLVSPLHKCLEEFFETNNNAIVQIGKYVLAVWFQRDMYFCFDPYSRNNEAFSCRAGKAVVSMNSNLETLMQTITTNFTDRDSIFYVHALKVLKVHRDPVQAQIFPKTMTMKDICPETLKKYKMRKSKKKAVDKPVKIEGSDYAMRTLLAGQSPDGSILEIGSTVESLAKEQLPPMMHSIPSKSLIKTRLPEFDRVIDLDSPSLSDTQIEPAKLFSSKEEEEIKIEDLDSYDLTMEEIELEDVGEVEGAMEQGEEEEGGEYEEIEGDEDEINEVDNVYMAMNQYSQIGSQSLDSYHSKMSAQINTDLTVGILPVPRDVLYPTNMRDKQEEKKNMDAATQKKARGSKELVPYAPEPLVTVTISEELNKDSNFVDLPDDSQLIRGSLNITQLGEEVEYMAPFICIMAAAVAQKYALISWSSSVIDYVLKCGAELYKSSKVRFDQVPKLEIPKVSLGKTDFSITVQYLYDTYMKQNILELALQKILFKKSDCGLVVTPMYACIVFHKNHLYYMLDSFGCNEVGLGEGPANTGVACFARFKDLHSLATRIMYNKNKRELSEQYEFTRFVLSSCLSRPIKYSKRIKKKPKTGKSQESTALSEPVGGGGEDDGAPEPPPMTGESAPPVEVEYEPVNKVGYQYHDGFYTIQGSTALAGRAEISTELKEDHFVCICANLMLMVCPIAKWDTRRVDHVVGQGQHVFGHADNLEVSEKRVIRNILIGKYFFDIIIKQIKIPDWRKNRNLSVGIDTIMYRRHYCIIQFPNASYVLHNDGEAFHIFDPYSSLPNGRKDLSDKGNAGWSMMKDIVRVKRRLKANIVEGGESYSFYTFEVTSLRKASKKAVISQRMEEYEMNKAKGPEFIAKPFHEDENWAKVDPIPWSRAKDKTASGKARGRKDNMWHNWEVEWAKDLYSLAGNIHQTSAKFEVPFRGKQTLANLVVAVGMLEIYELSEWSSAIIDSVLVNGHAYFKECVNDIETADYEISVEDLKPDCSIFPYSFKVNVTPAVQGTIYLLRLKQFNLYKALRSFFENRDYRTGIIFCTKNSTNRFLAFGKIQDSEYFMFDCQAHGPPLFQEKSGSAYMLRCKRFQRLLHAMVVTLKEGDFFIYDVDVSDIKPMN